MMTQDPSTWVYTHYKATTKHSPCYCEMRGCPCDSHCTNDSSDQTEFGVIFLGSDICQRCINYCRETYPQYIETAQ